MTTGSTISVAGTPTATDLTEPIDQVRLLAEAAANQRSASFIGSGLRLFEGFRSIKSGALGFGAGGWQSGESVAGSGAELISPFDLGRAYELALHPTARRKAGAHLTPAAVARGLVGLLDDPFGATSVFDPAVGGAAFLLAAADRLVAAGRPADEVRQSLGGIDIDPVAVAVAEAAIGVWSLDNGLEPEPIEELVYGDGLRDNFGPVDLIVGNPPFLNQLRSASSHTKQRRAALRERWGDLVTTYTDDAWLFLAAATHALAPGGSLAMVQPVSILAARHGQAVRDSIGDQATLSALWVARDQVFDAAVQVCGIVLKRHPHDGEATAAPARRYVGADFARMTSSRTSVQPHQWAASASATLGVPEIELSAHSTAVVADIAQTTAGFRDQFYGYVPFVHECPDRDVLQAAEAPLITVGMIDPFECAWGKRSFKFAKRPFVRPTVNLAALAHDDPSLARWTRARLRPKVLVATQTRVIEAWVDEAGTAVPATPVLSVEPIEPDDPHTLWLLAAALGSPVVTALVSAANFGTALSLQATKVAARDVLQAPLPTRSDQWKQAADLLRVGGEDNSDWFSAYGELMCEAYEVRSEELLPWWLSQLPNRSKKHR